MVVVDNEHEQMLIQDSARLALLQGDYRNAFQLLTDAVSRYPNWAGAYFLLSRIAYDFKNHLKEVEMLTHAYHLEPDKLEYTVYLARAQVLAGNTSDAVYLLARAERLENHTAEVLDVMGVTYNRLCMYEQAATCFKKAIAFGQAQPGLFFNLASSLKFCGDFAGARSAYESAIELKPDYYKAHAALTSLGGITSETNHIARLRELLPTATDPDDSLCIAHALSKELESLKCFDESMVVLAQAKQKMTKKLAYQFARDQDIFARLMQHFSAKPLVLNNGYANARAIFVVGMPRTGTTLVERIISNHSQVATGGELYNFSVALKLQLNSTRNEFIDSDFINRLGGVDLAALGREYIASTDYLLAGKRYLVDKLPLNILYAGLIIAALPEAKIVCLDRNPLDTVVSNYRQLFSFHDSTFGYTLNLEDAARYYVEFKRLVDHWQTLYPNNFYVVNYESLVANPNGEIKTLLGFCSLEWEEACLAVEKNSKPVATASAVQVRQPISAASVGQWKHYAAYLEPAIAILTDAGLLPK
ncbi:tetratricopeptide repeat-containing sulfotransferase family protein [Cellvibrio fibrivorans]|uniref:Tetratricopeptide (TPR) repeat protein n=1 Tax=Cellvibrio fibrivorans TaxID=126350 RepID=A0ABU1UWF1_9GAMM|nr:sulfotransferase [Cellvibrio fibrivorans]MDR7089480.1 tetratricopeptide (TPR) repeat protein [Cellvibrio fibrivorans]